MEYMDLLSKGGTVALALAMLVAFVQGKIVSSSVADRYLQRGDELHTALETAQQTIAELAKQQTAILEGFRYIVENTGNSSSRAS